MNVCIVQARFGSSRLPGKVLKNLPFRGEKCVLDHVLYRLRKCKNIDKVIIATTINSGDDAIVEWCKLNDVAFFRGSEKDVLSRFYEALKIEEVENVIRVTSDCPCIDSSVVDRLIEFHKEGGYDYTSNCLVRTFPHGLDVEVFKYSCIVDAYNNSNKSHEREHVTPYIYSTNKDKYKLGSIECKYGDFHDVRLTLDTEDDYYMLDVIFDRLGSEFNLCDIIEFYKNNKPYFNINKGITQKRFFEDSYKECEYSVELLESLDLTSSANILKSYVKNK